MKTTLAFMRKEWMEYYRTGKLLIVGTLFALFGLMNPAISKITPYLMKQIAADDSSGISIEITTVDASMSWTQFYKNIPIALIVCLLLFGGILTNELQKKTLIPVLTKGLSRWKVIFTKGVNLIVMWTVGFWMCYGITYFYNDYYCDNGILSNLAFAAFCYWLFGTMIMALLILFSAISSSMSGVVLGVGACYFVMTIISISSKIAKYIPICLTAGTKMLSGGEVSDYIGAIITSLVVIIVSMAAGCLIFNKREV